jgi:hypothetical protein
MAVALGITLCHNVDAQSFAAPVIDPFSLDTFHEISVPELADLDGDGDLDLLVRDGNSNFQYFENIGTSQSPDFNDPILDPFGLPSSYYHGTPCFVDLDNDGDLDLISGGGGGAFQYFENIGSASNPIFDSPTENPFGINPPDYMMMAEFCDLDNDGDFDLMIGGYYYGYGSFNYQKNNGSASTPSFAPGQWNPFGITDAYYFTTPAIADLDMDGDLDLISGSFYYGEFYFYENTGTDSNPQFALPQINPFGLTSPSGANVITFPAFGDLDDDGDIDILLGTLSYYTSHLFFYENTSPAGLDEPIGTNLVVYPNPSDGKLFVKCDYPISWIEIIDVQGRTLLKSTYSDHGIEISHLRSGMMYVRVCARDGTIATSTLVLD